MPSFVRCLLALLAVCVSISSCSSIRCYLTNSKNGSTSAIEKNKSTQNKEGKARFRSCATQFDTIMLCGSETTSPESAVNLTFGLMTKEDTSDNMDCQFTTTFVRCLCHTDDCNKNLTRVLERMKNESKSETALTEFEHDTALSDEERKKVAECITKAFEKKITSTESIIPDQTVQESDDDTAGNENKGNEEKITSTESIISDESTQENEHDTTANKDRSTVKAPTTSTGKGQSTSPPGSASKPDSSTDTFRIASLAVVWLVAISILIGLFGVVGLAIAGKGKYDLSPEERPAPTITETATSAAELPAGTSMVGTASPSVVTYTGTSTIFVDTGAVSKKP